MDDKLIFIADISSNHCRNLQIAKDLIYSAKESEANIVKFQYWETENFINKKAFENLKIGHQSVWKESVYNVYKKYQLPLDWVPILYDECKKVDIEFCISCYEISKVDELNKYVERWKVGSGDINYYDIIEKFIRTGKQIIFSLGCCDKQDWIDLIDFIEMFHYGNKSVFMQCNTNYKLDKENRKYVNLNLLDNIKKLGYKIGISDHTKDDNIIIGAIAKGASYIERHFKLDGSNNSPDNKFSLDPCEFRKMIWKANEFYECLGDGRFKIEDNEKDTRIVQRRGKDNKRPDLGYRGN